jgi:hypothetical protein
MEYTTVSVTGPDGSGSYEYIGCYPEYVLTGEGAVTRFVRVVAEHMGISESDITVLQQWPWDDNGNLTSIPHDRVVAFKDASDPFGSSAWFGFSDADLKNSMSSGTQMAGGGGRWPTPTRSRR